MIEELDHDIKGGVLYVSTRLSERGRADYPDLLRAAFRSGNEESLGADISQNGRLNSTVMRQGKPTRMPKNAHETLSEGEFNRFYIRALCRRAQDEGKELEICRAKPVKSPRPGSEAKIGTLIESSKLLSDLRKSPGVEPALGLPPGPNSGLSVKFPE